MKYIFLIILINLGFLTSYAQSCLQSGITFSTQAQVDAFSVNYPGCTNIIGGVSIGSNITNLGGLSQITTIGGAFTMFNNSNLQNFQGLNQLTSIGDRFQIVGNTNLQNFTGLNSLFSVNWYVEIVNNPNLLTLTGLDNLLTVGGGFAVSNCPITNLNGLNSLETVGGTFSGSLSFYQTSIQNFSGLNSIDYINGITISDSPYLTEITNLNNCNYGGGYTYIQNNPLLSSLNGMAGMVYSPGISITGNTSLENLNGLEGLLSCCDYEPLQISGNSLLQNLNGLDNLNSADQVIVSNNLVLSTLTGLSALQTSYDISISNNPLLSSISGLENVDINNLYGLNLQNNTQLSYCHLPNICDFLSIYPDAANIIGNNSTCANLSELELQCNILPIDLIIFIVTSKENDVSLHWQTSSEINNHYFDIEYSKDGSDFTTIGRKEGAGNSNTLLDYHFVHKGVDARMHYYRLKQVDYDGKYSYSDIKSVLVKGEDNEVSIFPNPTSEFISILGMTNGRYEIRDFSGKIVRSGDFISSVLSLEGLSAGIYFVSLTNNDLNGVFKVHKL